MFVSVRSSEKWNPPNKVIISDVTKVLWKCTQWSHRIKRICLMFWCLFQRHVSVNIHIFHKSFLPQNCLDWWIDFFRRGKIGKKFSSGESQKWMFVPETRSRRSWDVEMMRMKLPTARFRPKHRKKCVPHPLRLVLGRQRILQANWRELSSVLLGLATSRACYSSPVTQGPLSANARVTVICVSLVRHKVKELGCFKQARIGIILSTKCWITEEKTLRPSCSWWMLCHKLVFHRSDTCIVECRVSHTKGKRLGGGGFGCWKREAEGTHETARVN